MYKSILKIKKQSVVKVRNVPISTLKVFHYHKVKLLDFFTLSSFVTASIKAHTRCSLPNLEFSSMSDQ